MSFLSKMNIASAIMDLDVKRAFRALMGGDTIAAAGTVQGDATALTGHKNFVTAADDVTGVILPVGEIDMAVAVVNTVAASDLKVYPASGEQINALGANAAFTHPAGSDVTYYCDAIGHWYVRAGTTSNLYDHATTITAFSTGGQASATALVAEFNNVTTCGAADDSVKLPTAALGKKVTVKNSGAFSLAVFPVTSGTINALAANLSVNIPVNGELTFRAISATAWETNEVFVSPAPTTQRGEFVFKASDNAADHEVIFTNASHGQATTTTIPDPAGATGTVVLEEITNIFDLPQRYDANTTITAFSTGGQASATALTGEFNNVTTCGAAGDSVKLPAAAAGLKVTVKNSGAFSLAVFPAADDSINALAVDLSVNIPVGGSMTFRAKDATVWETNEVFTSPAPTTQSGEFVFKASDNAADHEVILTNASHGQATTHTHPDGGAATDYVVHSTAALTLVEADVLDDAVQGSGVASKAVVLDSSGNFKMADGDLFNLSADTLAAAGTTAGDAAALIDQMTVVTGADGAAGVVLPAAADLLEYTVVNDSPTYAVKVYPVSAGDDVINDLASDEAFILGPGRSVTLKAISATQWYADKNAAEPAVETHFTVFDDFLAAALDATDNWITFDGTTGAAQPATTVTAPEGQVTMVNGAANDAQDKTVMSLILLAKGALISLGKTVFETRVSFSAITGCSWGFGLGDVLAAGLRYNLTDFWGVTQIQWDEMAEVGYARRTMNPQARGENQLTERRARRLPVYLTWDSFELGVRTLAASQRIGAL